MFEIIFWTHLFQIKEKPSKQFKMAFKCVLQVTYIFANENKTKLYMLLSGGHKIISLLSYTTPHKRFNMVLQLKITNSNSH